MSRATNGGLLTASLLAGAALRTQPAEALSSKHSLSRSKSLQHDEYSIDCAGDQRNVARFSLHQMS